MKKEKKKIIKIAIEHRISAIHSVNIVKTGWIRRKKCRKEPPKEKKEEYRRNHYDISIAQSMEKRIK